MKSGWILFLALFFFLIYFETHNSLFFHRTPFPDLMSILQTKFFLIPTAAKA